MSRLLPLWLCLLLPLQLAAAPRSVASPAPEKTLEFVENKGQWPKVVRYQAEVPGGRLYLTPTGFTYSLLSAATLDQLSHRHGTNEIGTDGQPRPANAAPAAGRGHAYTVSFEGGNSRAPLVPEQATSGTRNYFVGSNPREWASGVLGYRQVRYQGVYAGIDVRVYENAGQHLEYDFELAPGAKPDNIRLRYAGPSALRLTSEGQLLIETSVGTVTEQAPQAWQTTAAGRRLPVSCRFELQGSTVRFRLGAYDARLPLTIDPTVLFSSFTGSLADNWGFTATYDAEGNMYSGGVAFGPGYPVSPGAFQANFAGLGDVAIIKYKVTTSGPRARLYATYLGGTYTDAPHSLVVNGRDELVIMGSTGSGNFPVGAAAAQRTFQGGPGVTPLSGMDYPQGADIFVATLSSDGARLVAATYLGGKANDGLNLSLTNNYGDQFRGDVLTDGDNNVYIASTSSSPDFPVSSGAQQPALRGAADAVVCQLPRLLDRLNWSTYLGGTSADAAFSLQLAPDRTLYVGGTSNGTGFPTVAGSLHPQSAGGREGFVVGLTADAGRLRYGTYLGTSADDLAFFVQLDNSGDVYVLGQTSSPAYPKTPGLYGTSGAKQFIHKLDATLSRTMFSTTFGSAQSEHELSPTAFLVDDCERVYVAGWGGSTNRGYSSGTTTRLPVTPNAAQKTTDGNDFYLAQFAAGLTGLEYATFYGEAGGRGEHVDGGTSRFSKKGIVYQAVCGGCGGTQNFPVPPGANSYTTRNASSNCNNAAFAINFEIITADPGSARYACASDGPVLLGGQPAGGTWSGPGVFRRPDGRYEFRPSEALVGRNLLQYSVLATGTCVSTRPLAMTVTRPVSTLLAPLPPLCATASPITLQATPAGGTWSGPRGLSGNTFDPRLSGPGTFTLTYTISDTVSCGLSTTTITVNAPPSVQAGPDLTLCAYETAPLQLTGATPAGGTWSGTGVTAAGLFTPPDTKLRGGIFTLTYSVTENSCTTTATRRVLLAPSPTTNTPLALPVCERYPQFTGLAPLTLTMQPVLTGGTYEWDFGDGSPTSTEENPEHVFTQPGQYTVRLVARYTNCTVETSFVPVVVQRTFVPNIITPNRDQTNQTFIPYFSCRTTHLSLFNRWGTKVYETADYHDDWQATGLPDGLYYYQLKDIDGRTAKGWLTVMR
ncbi:DUF7948 domain-containing protein [Hymenobacter aerophilus]|uniref:DUF7948 domain-containing protein n=1 Tax=Hymenobacter aerophilus TaxID=119644 RepID=UPI0012FCA301|nr:gliding motility-associated C-terminal domain-containing protein [Hymenobacter aerophilus]